jgi:HEAT repeat protein
MKTKILLFLLLMFIISSFNNSFCQKATGEWIKNKTTNIYSLKYEKKFAQNLYKENQRKYARNIDIEKIKKDLKNEDEQVRVNAIKILGFIPKNSQISQIESLLVNDPSTDVKMECARTLKLIKSKKSIPILVNQLNTDDNQFKQEIALTLAALGEKTECITILKELGKTKDRNLTLNVHLGYLDIATNDAIEELKYDLSDKDNYISVDAAIILAELGYFKETFPVLKSKLQDEDKYIRMAALRGLAYIGTDNAIELIKGLLEDTESLVNERASLILQNCGIIVKKKSTVNLSKIVYNPTAAASYAEQWCGSYNTVAYANYNSSGGDCANFVSQCIMAGGLSLSNGPGLDSYGCIINCDNLHTNFTSYQGCSTSSSTYSGHYASGYPSWFVKGDVAIFGCNSTSPSDYWQHAAIDVVSGTPILDAHSNPHCSSDYAYVSYFYPSTTGGFTKGDFYHFTTIVAPANDNCSAATQLTVYSPTCGGATSGTISGATQSIAPILCDGYTSTMCNDVWYKFTVTSTASYTITVVPSSGLDAVVDLRSGSCNGTNIDCSDNAGGAGGIETLTKTLSSGTYYVRVYDYTSNSTPPTTYTFTICVTKPVTTCNITSMSSSSETYNANAFSTTYQADDLVVTASGQPFCTYTITGGCSWLTISTPTSGSFNNNGQLFVEYSIPAYSGTTSRSCTIYVNGSPFTVTQNGCSNDFYDGTESVIAGGKTYNLDIDAYSACAWTITNPCSSWITLNQSNGTGETTISVTVAPNTACTTRTCTLTINPGGGTHVITQQASSPPSITLNPTSASFCQGYGPVSVSASGATTYTWQPGSQSGSTVNLTPTSTTTYTVTGTQNGCTATNTVTVTVNPSPTIIATPQNSSFCLGGSGVQLSATGASGGYYTWMPGSLSGSSVTVTPPSTTIYTVTGININGCSGSTTITVNTHNSPAITVSPTNPSSICSGSSIQLYGVGGITYTWQPGGLTGSPVSISPTVTTTYTVTGMDSYGCTASSTKTVTVIPAPTVTVNPSSTSICQGTGAVNLTANGADTYTWQPGSLSGSSINVTPYSTTTYTVTGNTNGCTGTQTATITVNPPPTINATPQNSNYCLGGPGIQLSATGVSGGYYTWMPGSLSGSSITVTPSSTTTYTVIGTNSNNCSGSTTITVNMHTPPTISTSPTNPSICIGGSIQISASGANSYSWQPGGLFGSPVSVSPTVTTTYTVTGTDSYNCTNSTTITVIVSSTPSITIIPNIQPPYCEGQTVILSPSLTGTSYLWSTTPPQTSSSISVTSPGTYPYTGTYSVAVTNPSGCNGTFNSTPINITIYANPPVPLITTTPNPVCLGQSLTLNTTSTGPLYSWSGPNGYTSNVQSPPPINPISMLNQGNYSLTVTTYDGCSKTSNVIPLVVNDTSVSITGNAHVCSGQYDTITATAGSAYIWSPGGQTTQTILVSTAGNYFVTVSNPNLCSGITSSASINVTSSASPPIPTITINIIGPNSVSLLAVPSTGYQYQWLLNNVIIPSANSNNLMYANDTAYYSIMITDIISGCSSTSSSLWWPSSINEINSIGSFNIFPNPSNDIINIKGEGLNNDAYDFSLLNILGQELEKVSVKVDNSKMELKFDTKEYSSGIYYLNIRSEKVNQTYRVEKL